LKFDISAPTKWQPVAERVVSGLTDAEQILPKIGVEMESLLIVHIFSRVLEKYVVLYTV
jgi:hypothetical protein